MYFDDADLPSPNRKAKILMDFFFHKKNCGVRVQLYAYSYHIVTA